MTFCTHASAGGHFQTTYILGPVASEQFTAEDDDGLTGGQPDGSIPGNGVPDTIDTTETALETAYFVYTTTLGFPEPVSGGTRIPVYMVKLGNSDGLTTFNFMQTSPQTTLGAIYMNPAGQFLEQATAAHELFHEFQYADYRFSNFFDVGTAERTFWYEATAGWAEYQYVLYRQQGDPTFDNPQPTGNPEWATHIDVYLGTPELELSTTSGDYRQYGVSWVAEYLSQSYPSAGLVRRTWELIAQAQTAKQAIATAVNEQTPGSFATWLKAYARSLYELGANDPANISVLRSLSTYGAGLLALDPNDPRYTGSDLNGERRERPARHVVQLQADVAMSGHVDIGELGMSYIDLNPLIAPNNGYVTVRVQRPDDNVQAQIALYQYANPADHAQGLLPCGSPVDLAFANGEATAAVQVGPCYLATLIVVRPGPSSPLNIFGSHVTWSATATISIGLAEPAPTAHGGLESEPPIRPTSRVASSDRVNLVSAVDSEYDLLAAVVIGASVDLPYEVLRSAFVPASTDRRRVARVAAPGCRVDGARSWDPYKASWT